MQDAAVRVRRALAGRARAQEELRHRRREPEAHGRDVAAQRLHRVVDREAGVDLAAGGVEVQRDRRRRRPASSTSSCVQTRSASAPSIAPVSITRRWSSMRPDTRLRSGRRTQGRATAWLQNLVRPRPNCNWEVAVPRWRTGSNVQPMSCDRRSPPSTGPSSCRPRRKWSGTDRRRRLARRRRRARSAAGRCRPGRRQRVGVVEAADPGRSLSFWWSDTEGDDPPSHVDARAPPASATSPGSGCARCGSTST